MDNSITKELIAFVDFLKEHKLIDGLQYSSEHTVDIYDKTTTAMGISHANDYEFSRHPNKNMGLTADDFMHFYCRGIGTSGLSDGAVVEGWCTLVNKQQDHAILQNHFGKKATITSVAFGTLEHAATYEAYINDTTGIIKIENTWLPIDRRRITKPQHIQQYIQSKLLRMQVVKPVIQHTLVGTHELHNTSTFKEIAAKLPPDCLIIAQYEDVHGRWYNMPASIAKVTGNNDMYVIQIPYRSNDEED